MMLSNVRFSILAAGMLLIVSGLPLAAFAQEGEVLEVEETAGDAPMADDAVAQDQGLMEEEAAPVVAAEAAEPVSDGKPVFRPEEYASLVFTFWEQDAIELARRAANGDGSTRAVTDYEIEQADKRTDLTEKIKPPPEKREIRLAGILFNEQDSWTIWLNEKRVTPEALPKEVIDLKVYKSYIEFKWFDDYTNRIYPIRLRPHQRFNIDTRIFLPG